MDKFGLYFWERGRENQQQQQQNPSKFRILNWKEGIVDFQRGGMNMNMWIAKLENSHNIMCCIEIFRSNIHSINLHYVFLTDRPSGWPILQVRLVNELVFTARRMGDQRFAVR